MIQQYFTFTFIIVVILLLTRLSVSKSIPNDDISIIRQRVLQLMIWPTTDNISKIIENAILYNKTLNSSCYWPDINYFDKGIHVWLTADHMYRIITMLQALTMNDSTIKNDPSILSSVHCALNVWLIKDWQHPYWWNNRIGIPLLSSTQLLMLGDNATDFEREKIKEISYRADWWNGGEQATGANLVWMIQIELYRSLATYNITGIEQGFYRMWDDVNIKTLGGQGIQYDWSYHFHGTLLLSGSYGSAWTRNIILFSLCSDQTRYELSKEKLLIIAKLLIYGDAWMIIDKQWDWQVVGRGIDIPYAGFDVPFSGNMIRMLMKSISLVDIRIELNNLADRLDDRLNASLLIGNKHFYTSDYQVHRRSNWIITIKMQSIRTMPVECFNQQNLKAEHLGQGILNLYKTNTKDYYYIFPLFDWKAINGMTVEHDIPLESCNGEPFGLIKKSFVGGVTDDQYGIAQMDTATHNLTVQRSWHFYDDAIIAFATNLTLITNNTAWTTLTSRLLKNGNITIGFFNSTIINLSDGIYSFNYFQNKSFNIQWIHIDQLDIAYLLQQQNQYYSLGIQLQTKIEQYSTIGPYNYTVKARTLTIWLDHGQGPYTRDYQYIILPDISLISVPTRIKQYKDENIFSCISTNNYFHGSIWSTLKRASFVLWENIKTTFSCISPSFEINIQLNNAGAYLFSETENDFTITVSHPIQINGTINVLIDRIGYGQGCQLSSETNTNITLNLPSLPELLGSSVNVTSQSPDELYGELFEAVQIQRIFSDSKTFCDAIPHHLNPTEILDLYRQEYNKPTFNLTSFIFDNFILPNTTTVVHDKWTIEQHCHRLWSLLTRRTNHENFSSFIDVPNSFVVPGGRFREFYYWDTYFTMLGLIRSNEIQLINDILENFAYLIRTIGHIPNGNRNYYEGRSQPPFFSLMTELVNKTETYKNELEQEYQFWMNKRSVKLDDGTILNRYYDDVNTRPRPEAYLEDTKTAHEINNTNIYVHLRAAAESGWDFSSRWMEDEKNLSTIITTNILPVDLNCLLYHLELTLNKQNEAERRRQAIQKYMWSTDLQFFTDYNYIQKKQTNRLTLAALYPLWLNVSTKTQSENVARQVESLFLRDGGVVTTISNQSTQQWDSPNGWAPLQFITYRALLQTPGYETLARTIRQRWMNLNERVFRDTSKMMEKYDVVNINKPAGGGEYATQDGFGWTNGVYLEMLHDQQATSNSIKHQLNYFQIIIFICFYFLIKN